MRVRRRVGGSKLQAYSRGSHDSSGTGSAGLVELAEVFGIRRRRADLKPAAGPLGLAESEIDTGAAGEQRHNDQQKAVRGFIVAIASEVHVMRSGSAARRGRNLGSGAHGHAWKSTLSRSANEPD